MAHGCSDSFSVFAFLAFLLALIDLFLELQGTMGGRKKREAIHNCSAFGVREDVACQVFSIIFLTFNELGKYNYFLF